MWSSLLARDEPTAHRRLRVLRILLALAGLTLVAATWRLWIPRELGIPREQVPLVPLVSLAARLPDFGQWLALAILCTALAAQAFVTSPRWVRGLFVAFAFSVGALVLADQARLQPWAYQFVVLALVIALAREDQALTLVRLFIVSFYVYSALTKFDYSFVHTLGQQFLSALAALLPTTLDGWSERARLWAAMIFPAGELAIGVALLVPRLRKAAVAGAVALHVLLLVILGPWGLNHRPGVLLWNAYFVVQDVIVFWPLAADASEHAVRAVALTNTSWANRFAQWITAAAIVFPLLGPTTWYDMWPSWGLYASNAERTLLLVHRRAVEELPTSLQAYCASGDASLEPWLSLRLDRWVLDSLDAPIYPQNRYQLALAASLIDRHGLASRARIVRLDLADRWTGERASSVLASPAQIQSAAGDYFFNARARATSSAHGQESRPLVE